MSDAPDAARSATLPPPLSWPPPGLERLQGTLGRIAVVTWIGSLILVLPLLWGLAADQPFWSLGPFGSNWEVGVLVAAVGIVVLVAGFGAAVAVLWGAARAAEPGYGGRTLAEVVADTRRDTGFLIQGRRHFSPLDVRYRARIVRGRLWGSALVVVAAVWLAIGFALAVVLAGRGLLEPAGVWVLTLAPTGALLLTGTALLVVAATRVQAARNAWAGQEGAARTRAEAVAWMERLDEAGDRVALGAGERTSGRTLRLAALGLVVVLVLALVPTATVAVTSTLGPILAEIAVPQFLSVQEMAGAAEVLRRYRDPPDGGVSPSEAGIALQNLAFVGAATEPEAWERAPAHDYPDPWFPEADRFPDPFAETVARELMATPFSAWSPGDAAALRQAAEHPAQHEFQLLSEAELVDVVSGRWSLPLPDTLTYQSLPWPRFDAFRAAGLAHVARAAVELAEGDPAAAEETLRELVSTGFLLVDEGPTLIDNLVGVVLVNMGGDALEGFYEQTGRTDDLQAIRWAREAAAGAARKARAGLIPEDVHSLLRGIPDLVLDEAPLRGLRWEYLATFNMLSPCINAHKMVFGPDQTYEEWRFDARDALVRVRGEHELFELAEGRAVPGSRRTGLLPRFLRWTLGSQSTPGSCAALVDALESSGTF